MDLRRSWPAIGLVVLLVLDLVLVVWALWPSPRAGSAVPEVTVTATASSTTSAGPSTDASSGSGDAPSAPRPLTRLLVAVADDVLWAVDVGSCADPGRVHVTGDRARSWTSRAAEGSVTRVRP